MLNTDIFDFEFVDRTEEKKIIDDYLDFKKNTGHYVLWICGKSGVGKTFLMNKYICIRKNIHCVYVDSKEYDSGNYLKRLLSKLSESAELKFVQYIKNNYTFVTNLGQKAAKTSQEIASLSDIGLIELITCISNYLVSKQKENENVVKVINKYIEEIIKKKGNTVILLDNFSKCDNASLDFLVQIIHKSIQNNNVRFIISTTDEDIEKRNDIKAVLAEKIPNNILKIEAFANRTLFVRMLEEKIDLDKNSIELIMDAFSICQGYPQRFKELLINLYSNQGFIISHSDPKAQFVNEIFAKLLMKKVMTLDIEKLPSEYKPILQIITLWGMPIPFSILSDLVTYLMENDPLSFIESNILVKSIQYFLDAQILERVYENGETILQFKHDSLFSVSQAYFSATKAVTFLHFCIYSFIKIEKNQSSDYLNKYGNGLLPYHAYMGGVSDWVEQNYEYAKFLYQKNRFYDADVIYIRIQNKLRSFSTEQLMLLSKVEYNCGKYEMALDILTYINKDELLKVDLKIDYYLLYATVSACMLEMSQAIEAISHVENIKDISVPQKINILSKKMSILFLSHDGYTQAKKIFDSLVQDEKDISEMTQVYISAMDFYTDEISIKYLKKGLSIANTYKDTLTEGKITNNLAFEYLRCGDYKTARQLYFRSIELIKQYQPHEVSYPYSNLAVLDMICKNYEEAINNIVEAIFWNKSSYAEIVLKNNLMLCNFFLGNKDWINQYNYLKAYIKQHVNLDDKIYKKICINLAFLGWKTQRIEEAIFHLEYYKKYMMNESIHGLYRYQLLCSFVLNTKIPHKEESPVKSYYYDIEFEPWIINITHY